jgi:hypothetical protein
MKIKYKIISSNLFTLLFVMTLGSCTKNHDQISLVDKPDTKSLNAHYVSNRAPLKPSALIKLPVGAIKPASWLGEYLVRQKNGLTGNLGKISTWLQKEDNAWLSKDGKGNWGGEEVPYWLKGYANIGYILQNQEMIDEAKIWLEGALNSQQSNGWFGPGKRLQNSSENAGKETLIRDYWPNMAMLYCLQSYYEYSGDERVITLMTNYFRYQLNVPDELFLSKKFSNWAKVRTGDNLHSVFWLYNRTGYPWLLELAKRIHQKTSPWTSRGHSLNAISSPKRVREGTEWPDWFGDLINWHNVNIAQGFREPAQYYLLSGSDEDLQASYDNHKIVRKYFGQVPGGMFGSDENCRPGYDDPRQGVETCGMVEQMNSDEHMLRITGDIFWADHAEEVAFNSYTAAVASDFKSLRYITSPNMVLNDSKNHNPGIGNSGPFLMFNPFSSRCCQHNHAQGWPYYAENLWMATPDNGLASVLYVGNKVTAKVGDGTEITIKEITNYPFEEEVRFKVSTPKTIEFPWYLRIPGWCENAEILINGKKVNLQPEGGKFVRMERTWSDGDEVVLKVPMKLGLRTWEKNHNSVSVDYGPLTFSLKIEEDYIRKESDAIATHDSKWQKGADTKQWPSWEIHPLSAWNYGLVLNKNLESSFEVELKPWPKDNFPFTTEAAPIVLKAKAKKIPNWKIDEYGLAGELQDSPVRSGEAVETVKLIPMGAARLRISSFPVIGESQNAIEWE